VVTPLAPLNLEGGLIEAPIAAAVGAADFLRLIAAQRQQSNGQRLCCI